MKSAVAARRAASPLRLLVVCGASYLGGGEVALLRVLERLAPEQVALSAVIVAPSGGKLASELGRLGLPLQVLPVGRARHVGPSVRAVRRLASLGRGACLLYANDLRAALYCQLAGWLARRPWVWHVRDLLSGANRVERAARLVRPTRLIAISGAVQRQAIAFGGWDPARIDIVRHGIDADALAQQADRRAWRAEVGLNDSEVAVGIVGRLLPWKGQDDFVRAAALLARSHAQARFFVVGGMVTDERSSQQLGDERARLERLASELGARDRIAFLGLRADVPSVMAGLDVLVLASHAEPFGLVLLEAMSQGTAVVATDAGGAAEVLRPDETGLLVPPRDPKALEAALARLLADPALLRALGRAGARLVRREFTLEREVGELVAAWEHAAAVG